MNQKIVTPAKAGIQDFSLRFKAWAPAFAGATTSALAAVLVFLSAVPLSALDPVGGSAAAASGVSHRPSLSHDGSRVAFETTARLSPDDTDRRQDVYVVDLPTGAPRRLPRSPSSIMAGGAVLSANGRTIAYHVIETAGRPDVQPLAVVLVHDLETGRTRRVPPNWFGLKADGEALYPVLGRNGRMVAFTSNAPGLAVRRNPPLRGVFLFEPDTDKVRLISRNRNGVPANRPSFEPRMSADGRFIGFLSAATNLEPALPADSLTMHLYLTDRSSGTLTRIDQIERGFDSTDWVAGRFDIDSAGDTLVFEARHRKPGKPSESLRTNDLFLFETSSGAVTRITSGIFSGRSHSPAVSGNGRWVAFIYDGSGPADKGGVVVYDRARDLWRRLVDGACGNPTISGDGRRIAFESGDPRIVGEKSGRLRIFVIDNPSFEEESVDAGD